MRDCITTTCDLCAGTAVVVPGEPHVCDPEKHAVGKHPGGARPTARQVTYLLAHWYWTIRDSHAGISAIPHPRMILLLLSLQCPDLLRWAMELEINGTNFDGVFGEGPEGQAAHKEMFPLLESLRASFGANPKEEGDPAWERQIVLDETDHPWANGLIAFAAVSAVCTLLYYLGGLRP